MTIDEKGASEWLKAVAWLHPTAGWARTSYHSVLVHCHKDDPGPEPLIRRTDAVAVIQSQAAEIERLKGEAEAWAAQLHHAEHDRDFNEKARAGWQSRAEASQSALSEALEVVRAIQELNMTNEDENGHRWANSDLIEQECHAFLSKYGREGK